MPVKPSKKLALIQRRREVADLYLQGLTQGAIAERMHVTQGSICHDLQIIRQQWRESAVRDFDDARALELQKLDLIEREAWAAWQRSQKPSQSAVVTGEGAGERSRKSVKNQYGDPRFLEQVNKCIQQRRALLGLDVLPLPPSSEETLDGPLTLEIRRERVLGILAALSQRSGVETTGTGPDGEQPGNVGAGNERRTLEVRPTPGLPGPGFGPGHR